MANKTSYRDSGVDIDAQDEALREVRRIARGTFTPNVISDIGSFGGLFRGSFEDIERPILVSSTDGVGTKLRVAQAMKVHDTVGYDLVCHCVNDILVQGARPLFFLDYYATGRLRPAVMTDVVRGMARACSENGCALIGGETAEMPGFYGDDDYDIAGFIVGVVDEKHVLPGKETGKAVRDGDVLIGLPSAGLHTNGYSLARRILIDQLGFDYQTIVPEMGGKIGEVLLAPHISYRTSPIRTNPREPSRLTRAGRQARIAAPRRESWSAGISTSASRPPLQAVASASAAAMPPLPTSWHRLRCGAAFQRKRMSAASAAREPSGDVARSTASPLCQRPGILRTSGTSPTQPTTGVGGIEEPSASL